MKKFRALLQSASVYGQVTRYCAVAAISIALAFGLASTLALCGFSLTLILQILTLVMWVPRFVLHKYWVFENTASLRLGVVLKYALIAIATAHMFDYVMWALTALGGMTELEAAFAIFLTTTGIGALRFLIFRYILKEDPRR